MNREQLTDLWRRFVPVHPLPWGLAIGIGLLITLAVAASTDLLTLPTLESENVSEFIRQADGNVQYIMIFVMAAVPVLEILIVIPIGIGLGLNPFAVAAFAFLGNVLPIYGIIVLYERLKTWWEDWTGSRSDPSKQKKRALVLWNRYGLPGLALVSPVATGVHLAAALALTVGSRKRSVAVWMTGAIALWTILLTAGTYYGIGYITGL
ncbi:small multi-drug export protein [Saliphagus infecundisoli]|uniref:Small multi-drug export protein n=1 Tax=Saliphagus infecundisoli TaxID=1849069 RepID=A0ABD5QLI5_9EURY|nr:small multi-drug export protein [Saliphagus infecundisoli]